MTRDMMAYLDHNATSPLRPEARAAMERAFAVTGNPSSVHRDGRAARGLIEDAREKVGVLVGARPQDVIFTSSGTEANGLALLGALQGAAEAGRRITRLFVSSIEHDSVLRMAFSIGERNPSVRVATIPVTREGSVDLDALSGRLREGKGHALISVMSANNETGVVQPMEDVAKLAAASGALLHVDAVQACGKIALDAALADYLSLSAHKIGGPQGVGALVVRDAAPLAAQALGGGQERGLRAGTENVIGIAGFGAAAAVARNADNALLAALRDGFESRLLEQHRDVVIFGLGASRLSNTSCFSLPRIAAETAMMALDLDGVMASSGAACSSGKVSPSHVLKAMGVSETLAASALRISFGWNSTTHDVDAVLASLDRLSARVRSRRAA